MKQRIVRTRQLASTAVLVLFGAMAGCTAERDGDPGDTFEEQTHQRSWRRVDVAGWR